MKRNIKKSKQLHNCMTLKETRRALNVLIRDMDKENISLRKQVVNLMHENVTLNIRLNGSKAIQSSLKEELAKAKMPWWKKVFRCL